MSNLKFKAINFLTLFLLVSVLLLFNVCVIKAEDEKDQPKIKNIRKVLIVPKGTTEANMQRAEALGIPEIADGIPPALQGIITENQLPYVYEEKIYEDQNLIKEETEKALKSLGADIAEYYPASDESIETGDIISILSDKGLISTLGTKYSIEKSQSPYDKKILGVIAKDSAMVIGGDNNTKKETLRPVALIGRVPVKASLENGPIEIGDYLTSSSASGIAMKATDSGQTIGVALEALDKDGVDETSGYGKVMVFINVGWHEGDSPEKISISGTFESILNAFKKMGIFIEKGLVRVKRIITSALVIETGENPEENTIGGGIIPSGALEAIIYNKNVIPTSKIFVTFRGDYGGRWWASEVTEGYFKISLSEIPTKDIPFDYWIIKVEDNWLPSVPATEKETNNNEQLSPPPANENSGTETNNDSTNTDTEIQPQPVQEEETANQEPPESQTTEPSGTETNNDSTNTEIQPQPVQEEETANQEPPPPQATEPSGTETTP